MDHWAFWLNPIDCTFGRLALGPPWHLSSMSIFLIFAWAPGGIYMQCIVFTFRAGYEHVMYHPSSCYQVSYIPSSGWGGSMVWYGMVWHGMYHPSTCCQVSYIPSSGWGGSCLPSGTSPTLIISAQERFSPNPNSFLTNSLTVFCLQTRGGLTKHA